jgi:hypothetical protein
MKFKAIFIVLLALMVGCTQTPVPQKTGIRFESVPEVVASLLKDVETDEEKLKRLFVFVRDEIQFDFVYPQDVAVETVLRQGRGVCMQKANLLVALVREADFEARFKFIYVRKQALEDFLPGFAYKRWIDPFPHTIAQVFFQGRWISLDPSFDTRLHHICLKRKINFARHPFHDQVSTEFNSRGVIGHQQYFKAEGIDTFVGEDLSPLMAWRRTHVPWYKKMLQPMIFKKASARLAQLRAEEG